MVLPTIWEQADEGCENHEQSDAGKRQSDPAYIHTNIIYFLFWLKEHCVLTMLDKQIHVKRPLFILKSSLL